ncbi:MAG: DUF4402 domain-containing protein [Telluria sp.]
MNKHSRITSNVFRLAVLALAMAGAGSAMAADGTATTSGTVVKPIAVAGVADLVFGSFAAGTALGSVTISTSGARTSTNVTLVGDERGAAQFDVTGTANLNYTFSLAGTTLTGPGGATMTFLPVSDLSGGGAISGAVTGGTLNASGEQSVFVGGVLTVGSSQAPGDYTGELTATVAYE